MKRLLAMFTAVLLLTACGDSGPKPEELALHAAKAYYDQLIHGDYDSFVDGTLKGDSVPLAYRQQLLLNMQMYMEEQKKEHGGIISVEPLRATADTASHTANAFLTIAFADSLKEEIVVPMVEKQGVWYLR